jgi:hypothetical protein
MRERKPNKTDRLGCVLFATQRYKDYDARIGLAIRRIICVTQLLRWEHQAPAWQYHNHRAKLGLGIPSAKPPYISK